MKGVDWAKKVVVGESSAGSGLGKDASCFIWARSCTGIEEDVGTAAAEA